MMRSELVKLNDGTEMVALISGQARLTAGDRQILQEYADFSRARRYCRHRMETEMRLFAIWWETWHTGRVGPIRAWRTSWQTYWQRRRDRKIALLKGHL